MENPRQTTLNCRMYEQKYPDIEDLVMVEVKSVTEMGAYVSLLEYDNIEGMIMSSEYTRRRIRSINQVIRVGKQEVSVVVRVDQENGYIDLSKRRVTQDDIAKCEKKYNQSKTVHSIMKHVAETTNHNTEDLYIAFGWPLYKKFGHAYTAFKVAITDPSVLDPFEIEPKVREALLKDVVRRLTPQAVKLRADFEITCFHYEGIDAIKACLTKGLQIGANGQDEGPLKIKLVAPPLFVLVTSSCEKELGLSLMNESLALMKEEIQKFEGNLVIKNAPRSVTEKEEKELSAQLAELEQKNREVDGDDEESGEETEEEE